MGGSHLDEGSEARARLHVDVGAGVQQNGHDGCLVGACRREQCRVALMVLPVDERPLGHKQLHHHRQAFVHRHLPRPPTRAQGGD